MEQKAKKKTRIIRSRVDQGWYFSDLGGFTQAESNMIVEWWPWAMTYFINYKKMYPQIPEDELYDAGVEALIYCVKTWDANKGANFKSWFHKGYAINIRKYVQRYLKKSGCLISENTPAFSTTSGNSRRNENEIKDCWFYGSTQWEEETCSRIDFEEMMGQLTDKQRDVVERVYINREKQTEIAADYGVTRQAIQNILVAAKKSMRLYLEREQDEKPKIGRPRKFEKCE